MTSGMVAGLLVVVCVFLLSIPVALFVSATTAEESWLLMLPIGMAIRWQVRRRTAGQPAA